jgi:hypothetical protein
VLLKSVFFKLKLGALSPILGKSPLVEHAVSLKKKFSHKNLVCEMNDKDIFFKNPA